MYDVFTFSSGTVIGIENFQLAYRGTLNEDLPNQKFTFTSGGVGTRTWNSADNDGYWDIGLGTNWLEGDNLFFGGDTVVFGDISEDALVNLEGNLPPESVSVNNAANQTFGSAVINMAGGSITGIAGSNIDLFANGSAINTLASVTTSTISLPTMNLRQNNTAFGIEDGAAAVDLLLSSDLGNGAGGNHNLIKNGAGTMVLSGTNTYNGITTVAGGTLTVSGTTSATSAVTVNGTGSLLVPTGGNLTSTGALSTAVATGASIVVESGATLAAASSLIAWNPGTFKIDGALNVTGTLAVSTNATTGLTGAGTITAGSFFTGNAATVVNYSTAATNLSGSLKLGTSVASHSTSFNQIAGVISAEGLQVGDAASTVAQTYSISGGTLRLGSSGIATAGTGARTVNLGAGTLGAIAPWSTTLAMALTSTTTGTTFDTTGGNLIFTFKRDQDSKTPETALKIEVGTTLATWPSSYTVGNTTADSSAGVNVTDNLDGTDTITLTVPQAPDAKKFARLRVDVTL